MGYFKTCVFYQKHKLYIGFRMALYVNTYTHLEMNAFLQGGLKRSMLSYPFATEEYKEWCS